MNERQSSSSTSSSIRQAVWSRLPIVAAALGVMALGLLARYGLSGWAAKYLGLGLWATMVYVLVVVVRPSMSPLASAAAALAVCWVVEFAQMTPVPAWLSSKHVILRLIFGIGFSAWDLPTYAVGVALGAGVHALVIRVRQGSI